MRLLLRVIFVLLAPLVACSHQHPAGGGGGGGTGGDTAPVPASVRKVVDDTLGPDAKIGVEHEHGATIYEAATKTKLELELSETGAIQKTEVAIPVASLPAAVASAVAARGKISEAEVVLTAAGPLFELEVGDTELTVDATGKIVEEEHEEHEEAEPGGEDQ
jgi:hypothetical protein